MKVFVYGTLRRGEPAHGLLQGARLVTRASTDPEFTLVDMMAGYPAMLEGGTTCVVGEIYELDEAALGELDRYEEAPELFQRVTRRIAGHDVWVYVLPERHAVGRPRIAGGDWRGRGR
jgi:gamma-glutamylaminecyclotransferase